MVRAELLGFLSWLCVRLFSGYRDEPYNALGINKLDFVARPDAIALADLAGYRYRTLLRNLYHQGIIITLFALPLSGGQR